MKKYMTVVHTYLYYQIHFYFFESKKKSYLYNYKSSLGRKNLIIMWIWPPNMNTEQNIWWKLIRISLTMFPGLKHIEGFMSIKLGTWNMYETNFTQFCLDVS